MELIYNLIDSLVEMNPFKRFFATLGVLTVTVFLLAAAYMVFRVFNLIGLGVFTLIFNVLVPRDSVIERVEMRRLAESSEIPITAKSA